MERACEGMASRFPLKRNLQNSFMHPDPSLHSNQSAQSSVLQFPLEYFTFKRFGSFLGKMNVKNILESMCGGAFGGLRVGLVRSGRSGTL